MSTMIERVSRAIVEADVGEHISDSQASILARAAILAMREPTDTMISAWLWKFGDGGKAEYEAMIDAALKEETV